jgi:hypothetical protein
MLFPRCFSYSKRNAHSQMLLGTVRPLLGAKWLLSRCLKKKGMSFCLQSTLDGCDALSGKTSNAMSGSAALRGWTKITRFSAYEQCPGK